MRLGFDGAGHLNSRIVLKGRVNMTQNCEYPQCGTSTGIFRSFKNITGKGKSHIDIWLCDRCEALRRANDSAFMRWLEERIRTVVA